MLHVAARDRQQASSSCITAMEQADAVAREAAEFEECTFQPGVAPLPLPSPDGVGELGGGPRPVVVHGLNSFLERKVGQSTSSVKEPNHPHAWVPIERTPQGCRW